MASEDHIAILRSGSESWNRWRDTKQERPDLRDWNFEQTHPRSDPCVCLFRPTLPRREPLN